MSEREYICPACLHNHSGDCLTCAWRVADERLARLRTLEDALREIADSATPSQATLWIARRALEGSPSANSGAPEDTEAEIARLREAILEAAKRSNYVWSQGGDYTAGDFRNEGAIILADSLLALTPNPQGGA